MIGQPTPGVPVYTVKSIAGGRPRVHHRNLLQPLQGRIRQEGGVEEEGSSDSEDEEQGGDEMPIARTPYRRPRGTTRPQASPTQQRDAYAVLSEQKTLSMLTSPFSPEHMAGDEDSTDDEEYTDSLTSPTTAIGSTTVAIPPSTAEVVADNSNLQDSPTKSQLAPKMPCLGGSTPPDQTTDSVSTQQHSDSEPSDDDQSTIIPVPPAPRRSARSTKGIPPVYFGKVHISSTFISEVAKPTKYKQTLYVPCYQIV